MLNNNFPWTSYILWLRNAPFRPRFGLKIDSTEHILETFVENSHSASVVCRGPSSDSHLCSVNPNIAAYICRNTCTQAYAFIYELPITDTIYRLKQKTWTKNLFHLPLLLFLVFFLICRSALRPPCKKWKYYATFSAVVVSVTLFPRLTLGPINSINTFLDFEVIAINFICRFSFIVALL